jgi:hypothetical protein
MFKKIGTVFGCLPSSPFLLSRRKERFTLVEQQSFAYCLENMWLKETTLDLGFQFISATVQLAVSPEF